MRLGHALRFSLINQTGHAQLMRFAADKLGELGKRDVQAQLLRFASDNTELNELCAQTAIQLVASKFDLLHQHLLVNMWGALSTGVSDAIALCLHHDSRARAFARSRGIKRIDDATSSISKARTFSGRLQKESLDGLPVHEAWSELLDGVGMPLLKPTSDFSEIEEVRVVRNCVVHTDGIVDDYTTRQVPSLLPLLGLRVTIDEQDHFRQTNAITKFMMAFFEATLLSRHTLGEPE